jgi:hypothetical protein
MAPPNFLPFSNHQKGCWYSSPCISILHSSWTRYYTNWADNIEPRMSRISVNLLLFFEHPSVEPVPHRPILPISHQEILCFRGSVPDASWHEQIYSIASPVCPWASARGGEANKTSRNQPLNLPNSWRDRKEILNSFASARL